MRRISPHFATSVALAAFRRIRIMQLSARSTSQLAGWPALLQPPCIARKIDLHQNVLLLKHFEYRRTLGYVGLVFVVRTLFTSLDVHSVPA